MRWGVHSYPGFEGAQAWIDGLRVLGHQGVERSQFDHGAGQIEAFDVVVVFGLQGRGRQILEDYQQAGIPVVVIDYGYVKRTNHAHDWRTGHWQVSPGRLNHIPPFECPSDRFDALGIRIADFGGDPFGYTLVCAQTTGDASHGMNEQEIQAWVDDQMQRWPQPQLRPHPLEQEKTYQAPLCQAKTLQEALKGARLVVTANSNTGHEALMAGVPAVATMPGAAWAELSGTTLPSKDQRMAYLHRMAWGQWTWAEMAQGLPQTFLLQRWASGLFGTNRTR